VLAAELAEALEPAGEVAELEVDEQPPEAMSTLLASTSKAILPLSGRAAGDMENTMVLRSSC